MSVADRLGFGPTRSVVVNHNGTFTIKVKPPAILDLPEQSIILTDDQYSRYKTWVEGASLIHIALPDLSPAERETLMTGLGNEDFHRITKNDEKDEEE